MDLLVQQKIHAAMQPLFDKIYSLEQQLNSMTLQIQTLKNENQLKMNSHLSNSIEVQTQQTRIEHKVGTDKSKINKQHVVEKINNKKENNGAKVQSKMEMSQNHCNKKEVKRQPAKSFKTNAKENKTETHVIAQKSKKPLEQKQSEKMMKQPAEDMLQKVKVEIIQPTTQKMNDTKLIEQLKQQKDESIQIKIEINQRRQNIQMNTEKPSIEKSANENKNEMPEQEELLITPEEKQEANIVVMPSNLTESIVYKIQNSNEPQTEIHQNKKVQVKNQEIQKIQSKESHSLDNQPQIKVQITQVQEIMKQVQSSHKQELKTTIKPLKEYKLPSSMLNKKQPNLRKKTEENHERMNKSTIIHKQKMETKPRKDSVKESNIKQKNVGKSVDPVGKKMKSKEEPRTEKKSTQANKTESALNEQDMVKEKQELQKQQEENLLSQTKTETQA